MRSRRGEQASGREDRQWGMSQWRCPGSWEFGSEAQGSTEGAGEGLGTSMRNP